jgi:signal transduction histidine kinase
MSGPPGPEVAEPKPRAETQADEPAGLRDELVRLRDRLERERAIRRETEAIAEKAVRDLYDRQRALTLLQTVAAMANRTETVDVAFQRSLDLICEYTGWPVGHVYLVSDRDPPELAPSRIWHLDNAATFETFRQVTESTRLGSGDGLPGRVLATGEAVWIADVSVDPNFPRARKATGLGVKTAFAFPIVASGKVAAVMEFFAQAASGPDRRLLETMASVGEQLGRVIERSESAGRLRAQARELLRSNEELQQFAYVASHDLQEPLRMVASYTQLLAQRYGDKLDADAGEFINYAVDGARRMQALINDLLAYSRVGTRAKPFAPVSCEEVVGIALQNLRVAVAETGATVRFSGLPVVTGDSSQLVQLFQNLIGNAIKFRRPDVAAQIQISAQREAGGWQVAVSDNGIGIDPQHFDRIFVIFQRLHTRDRYAGTGIGLAVCRKIVERHGGRLWVESEAGSGSVFRFTLPDHHDEESS